MKLDRRVCIAPMLGWTDRHARYFFRQITRHAVVFSEMLAPEAIVLGRKDLYLRFHEEEHPVVFQLGGNDPKMLAAATLQLEKAGFDEVNLNVGCPSPSWKSQDYGAHLMKKPDLVARCIAAMQEAVSIPVSIKTRIGVDRQDTYQPLADFVGQVSSQGGCRIFTIHARKAWLDGLSPKENRDIPPLRYEYVYRLKREFPHLQIIINGGIILWDEARRHMQEVDGVMVGRRAYKDPYWLATVDRDFFGSRDPIVSQSEILRRCLPYVETELSRGTPLREMLPAMMGLYRDLPAAKAFRRQISVEANPPGAGIEAFLKALDIAERMTTRVVRRSSLPRVGSIPSSEPV